MSKERKVRKTFIILFAVALLLPVYDTTILFGQNLRLTIFTHANLGGFYSIFWPILILGALYVVNYQEKFQKVADWIFVVAVLLNIIFIMIARSANSFSYMYGFLVEIILLVGYVMLMFVKDILYKGLDFLGDLWKKVDGILGGKQEPVTAQAEFDPSAYDEYIKDDYVYDDEVEEPKKEIKDEEPEEERYE